MKKRISVVLMSAFLLLSLSSCGGSRHVYTAEDRPVVPASQAMRLYESGIDTNTVLSDLIAEVEITSEQETEELTLSGGVPYPVCKYQAKVRNVWYGETDYRDIVIWFVGTRDVLYRNDRAIMYLRQNKENNYVPVDGEYSVFLLNPPEDVIFPYSVYYEYDVYENQDVRILKEATEESFRRIENGEVSVIFGIVGDAAKESYDQAVANQAASE